MLILLTFCLADKPSFSTAIFINWQNQNAKGRLTWGKCETVGYIVTELKHDVFATNNVNIILNTAFLMKLGLSAKRNVNKRAFLYFLFIILHRKNDNIPYSFCNA